MAYSIRTPTLDIQSAIAVQVSGKNYASLYDTNATGLLTRFGYSNVSTKEKAFTYLGIDVMLDADVQCHMTSFHPKIVMNGFYNYRAACPITLQCHPTHDRYQSLRHWVFPVISSVKIWLMSAHHVLISCEFIKTVN